MPTATPFTALGTGNGFTSCLFSTDVDDWAYWTTLSGVNPNNVDSLSDSELNDKIEESRAGAMSLFWNLYRGVGLLEYENSTPPPISVSETSSDDVEPMNRVCQSPYSIPDLSAGSGMFRMIMNRRFRRLQYNGRFVGYSAGQAFGGQLNTFNSFFYVGAGLTNVVGSSQFAIAGALEETPVTPQFNIVEAGYVQVGDLHFVAYATARDGDGSTGSIDLENLTSSSTSSTTSSITRIDGFEFYTYA